MVDFVNYILGALTGAEISAMKWVRCYGITLQDLKELAANTRAHKWEPHIGRR